MRRAKRDLGPVLLCMVLAPACAGSASSPECATAGDCTAARACIAGTCADPVTARPPPPSKVIPIPASSSAGTSTPNQSGAPGGNAPSGPGGLPKGGACSGPMVQVGGGRYCTLGQALAAAPSGGVIDIPGGTYLESLNISRDITLRGSASDAPVFQALTATSAAITVAGGVVTIQNAVIRADGDSVLKVRGQVNLDHVTITGAAQTGVSVDGQVTMTGCLVDHVDGVGVRVAPGASATINSSTIRYTGDDGVYTTGGFVSLTGSKLEYTGISPTCANQGQTCWPGILADGNSIVRISGGSSIQYSGSSGIVLLEGSTMTMESSDSSYNGMNTNVDGDGITLVSAGSVTLRDVQLNQNSGDGFWCYNSQQIVPTCTGTSYNSNRSGGTNCPGC